MSSICRQLAVLVALVLPVGASGAPSLPMTPERTLEFDTREGTWMSVDVSPDGEQIVFDLLGDLYVMDANGGRARALTRSMALDTQPAFSPDGREIVFISDRSGAENVWVMSADGTSPRRVSAHEGNRVFISPAWSADGTRVFATIFRADLNAYGLWAFDAAGGDAGEVVVPIRDGADAAREQQVSALGATASGDGRYLYYARHEGKFDEDLPAWTIHRRDLASGEDDEVVEPAQKRRDDGYAGSYFRPAVSPDGRRLAYATRHRGETGIRLRNLETGDDRWLALPVQHDQLGAYSPWQDILPRYDFTPGGDALVFSHDRRIRRLSIDSGEITDIPFEAQVELGIGPSLRQTIRQDTGPVRARLIQSPQQSPDGERLAFSALGRLYTQRLDGTSHPEPLTSMRTPQFQPSWSRDGRQIAFVTWTARDGGHVWVAPVDGEGEPRRVTVAADFYTNPVFAPDGESIIAVRSSHAVRMHRYVEVGDVREAELVSIPLDGGEARVLTNGKLGGRPHFTGAQQQLAVAFDDGVYTVDATSGERSKTIGVRGPGWYFAEGPGRVQQVELGPAGRFALAQNAQQLHLVAVPGDAGDAVDLTDDVAEYRQLTSVGADFIGWADGGRTITWSVGSTYYRCPLTELGETTGGRGELGYGCGDVVRFEAIVELPRDKPGGALLLRGATVITMDGDRVVENADLLIVDDKIAGVAPRGELDVPADVAVRDIGGHYIVPGFIDAHDHVADIRRGVLDFESFGPAANLAYGVTTAFDPSTLSIDMLAYEDLVDAGLMIGSRIHSTGPAIFSFNRFRNLDEVRDVLRRYRDHYRTRNLKMYRSGNRRVRQWVAMAAQEFGMMPTTEGALAMKLGLTQVIDGYAGLEHELAAFPLAKDAVELMAQSGVAYTPTLIIAAGPDAEDWFIARDDPASDTKINRFWPGYLIDMKLREAEWHTFGDYTFPAAAAGAAEIARAGGRVAVGGHGNAPGIGTHWEMQALATGGMTPLEVLAAATRDAAAAIGREAEFGSIEAGKYADLVILSRDPRDDIANTLAISEVMKNGRLYNGDTLNELWPRRRAFPHPWFRDEAPARLKTYQEE